MGNNAGPAGWVRLLDRYGWVAVLVAGLAAYHNSFQGVFFIDDHRVVGPVRFGTPDLTWPPFWGHRWLGTWSFGAGAGVFGNSLRALHAVNLGIHLLAGLVLWALVGRTLRSTTFDGRYAGRAGVLATAVAAVWVAHPLTTQAVTYLVQRYESLMGLFALVSVWAAARGAAAGSGRRAWYAAAVVAAYAALSTKEPAFVLPGVILAYDRLFLAGSWRGAVRRRWALYLALLATEVALVPIAPNTLTSPPPTPAATAAPAEEMLILQSAIEFVREDRSDVSAGFWLPEVTPWMYLRTQPGVILHYLRLAVWPHPLCLDYAWPVADHWWQIWPPGSVIIALLGATAWPVLRGYAAGFLGVWFFGFLAASSSFLPIADLAFEHRMYLPLAAVVAAGVFAGDRLLRSAGPAKGIVAVAVVVGCVVLTIRRNDDYDNEERMFRANLTVRPECGRAWNNLGVALAEQDKYAEAAEAYAAAGRNNGPNVWRINRILVLRTGAQRATVPWDELVTELTAACAEQPSNAARRFMLAHAVLEGGNPTRAADEYRTAIAMRGDRPVREPMVFGYYGQALAAVGRTEEAVAEYRRAVELDPNAAPVRNSLGQALVRLGRHAEAETHLRAAAGADPQGAHAPFNLGVLRMHQGNPADAAVWFRESYRRDPRHLRAAVGLAHALHDSGRVAEARAVFAKLHQGWPTWAEEAGRLAWQMSTLPDPRGRYGREGLRLARSIVAGGGDGDAGALNVLAAALAETGAFDDAARTAERAAALARAAGQAAFADEIDSHLRGYRTREPFRQSAGGSN